MKKSGKLVNSTSGIKVTVTTVTVKSKDGKEMEFIRINTDKKPSQTVINAIKLHGGSWYNQDQTWSVYNNAKNQRFVNKVILKDCFKIEEEEKTVEVKTSKPQSKAKGKAKTTNTIEDRVNALEKAQKENNKKLDKILALLSK